MYNDKRILGIIPARSGSKGLKDKNIKEFCGKPLIAYTIEAAKESGVVDEVFVSTNSEVYQQIALDYGAEVPFLRSEQLSNDIAGSWDVVREALFQYGEIGKRFDSFILLQPTSPLRDKNDIVKCIKLLYEKEYNGVISVCEEDHVPAWAQILSDDMDMKVFSNGTGSRRQEYETFYRINGAIYALRVDYFTSCKNIYEDRCHAYIMAKEKSVDIDDEFDFLCAEALYKHKLIREAENE